MIEEREIVRKHYSREEVRSEVMKFSKGRWIALSGRKWIRYFSGRPITVEMLSLPETLINTGTRAVYSTASIYGKLYSKCDAFDPSNFIAVTPFLDIDNELENWRGTVEAVRIAVDILNSLGISKSVYVLWSGRGAHVRVNEFSFSEGLRNLDSAWALIELLRMRVEAGLLELGARLRSSLKVENQMKPRALFTVPLSLHKKLNRVAVCVNPDELDDFEISWTDPESFRHWKHWERYEEGEADKAAEEALSKLGGYSARSFRKREPPVDEMVRKFLDPQRWNRSTIG